MKELKERIFSARGGVDLFLVVLGLMFIQAGFGKVLGGQVPDWFVEQFAQTLIGSLPGGLVMSFWTIAILEVIVGFLAFISILKANFFNVTLVLAELCFLMLGFGLRLSGKYGESGQLFNYFALTLIIQLLVTSSGILRSAKK